MPTENDQSALPVRLCSDDETVWRECEVKVTEGGLVFSFGDQTSMLAFEDLAGLGESEDVLALFPIHGKTLRLKSGDDGGSGQLRDLLSRLDAKARRLHEFTRSLRTFGTRSGRPGPDHDHFFEPLMAARRAAESGQSPLAKLDAFDAARMETMLEEVLLTFATERFPREAAERRALHESIRYAARGIFAALHLLEEAAVAARTAGAGEMLTAWRSWLAAVDRVFVAADAAWPEVNLMLLDARESGARSR